MWDEVNARDYENACAYVASRSSSLKKGDSYFQVWLGHTSHFIGGPGNAERLPAQKQVLKLGHAVELLLKAPYDVLQAYHSVASSALHHLERGKFTMEEHILRREDDEMIATKSGIYWACTDEINTKLGLG